MAVTQADIRICFVGDSFVNGTGDPTHLGWVGRVCAAAHSPARHITHYNLGIRRDTSADILARWQGECEARFSDDSDNRIVFSFGVNDATLENGTWRVSAEKSTINARTMLTNAKSIAPVLMIGPLPIDDKAQNTRIGSLDQRYATLCAELSIPYLSLFDSMLASPIWLEEARANDGAHPFSAGYQLVASHILNWDRWWFP